MRLKILPLILCLFVSVIVQNGNTLSARSLDSHAIGSTENTANEALGLPVVLSRSFMLTALETDVQSSSFGTPFVVHNMLAASNQFSFFEENSYKNNNFIPQADIVNSSYSSTSSSIQNGFLDRETIFRQGAFYGFALMLILLNLVCYILFDEKIFMFYSLALAGIIATFFFVDGLPALLGFSTTQNPEALQATLLLISAAFSALFASKYLSHNEFFPKLHWVTIPLLSVGVIALFIAWFAPNSFTIALTNTIAYAIVTCYFTTGVILFSKKNYAKFYVIAYCIPLLFAIDFFVLRSFGIEFLSTQASHLKAASLVEMLVLTYAIMYRMRAIKEENQLRQTELRIFLKRQEVVNRKNAEKLMEEVYLENLIMHYDLDGLEIKLLQYISEGKDNVKIARKLKVSEVEIEQYTRDLYEKLEISEHIQEDYRMVDNQPDYIYN